MGFSCGIVGLPNVGKSTIFNAITRSSVPAANYPFCTIEPNVGIVPVPDPRLATLARLVPTARVVPTTFRFVDIAGLVKGASQGEGLGNQFLGHIAEVEAIAHVVRCFEDPDVVHVGGTIDPRRDAEVIATELALRDLGIVTGAVSRVEKQARSGDKKAAAAVEALRRVAAALDRGEAARTVTASLTSEERAVVKPLNLITAKPMLYVANVGEADVATLASPVVQALQAVAVAEGVPVVPICGALEAQIAALESEAERAEYLAAVGLAEPGLHRLIRAGYDLLGLITFFTVGPTEDRAWTIRRGTKAPQAAGVIHSDFERAFIRAEVIGYDDFVACGSEPVAKARGKLRVEGKDYIVQDGDLLNIRHGA
ncbi:MAG: redox-regulated ATPase YchF [Candidatus Omnitrophica bacterium]|nr:redox-regulated ATPase YchF [Candidatus Omnitrophota bacterium]